VHFLLPSVRLLSFDFFFLAVIYPEERRRSAAAFKTKEIPFSSCETKSIIPEKER